MDTPTSGIRRFFWRPRNKPGPKKVSYRETESGSIGDSIANLMPTAIGRQTTDDNFTVFGEPSRVILPPPSSEDDWRTFTLDANSFNILPPDRILELLADLSPEVSKALWDYLRLCNPGWDFRVVKLGSQSESPEGKKIVEETLNNWAWVGGSMDTIFSRCNISAFLRGAIFTEVIFDNDKKTAIGLATPDPITARFEKVKRGALGETWQLGQIQQGIFRPLVKPTIQYIPIDPFTSKPYGRPLASPAIFTSLFMLGMLHDLRRVIAQQGYPRIDISIDTDVLFKMAPMDVRNSPIKLKAWIDDTVAQVKSTYANLDPTDAYIHVSAISINKNVGVVDSESLGSVSGIIQSLERMSIRALKTMPLLMAVMEGASDANSNRQWEIEAQGIKSIQHVLEHIMQRSLGIVLRANGVQAKVIWRFAELRSSEALRDAQTETLQIQNETNKFLMGFIEHEEAGMNLTGHKPVHDGPVVWPNAPTNEPPANPTDVAAKDDGSPTNPVSTKSIESGDSPIILNQYRRGSIKWSNQIKGINP